MGSGTQVVILATETKTHNVAKPLHLYHYQYMYQSMILTKNKGSNFGNSQLNLGKGFWNRKISPVNRQQGTSVNMKPIKTHT